MRTAIAKPETSYNIAQTRTDHPELKYPQAGCGWGGPRWGWSGPLGFISALRALTMFFCSLHCSFIKGLVKGFFPPFF